MLQCAKCSPFSISELQLTLRTPFRPLDAARRVSRYAPEYQNAMRRLNCICRGSVFVERIVPAAGALTLRLGVP